MGSSQGTEMTKENSTSCHKNPLDKLCVEGSYVNISDTLTTVNIILKHYFITHYIICNISYYNTLYNNAALLYYLPVITLPLTRVSEMTQRPFTENVILTVAYYLTKSQNRVNHFRSHWIDEPQWFSKLITSNKRTTACDADSIKLLRPLWKDQAVSGNTKPKSQLLHQGFAGEETAYPLTRNLYYIRG